MSFVGTASFCGLECQSLSKVRQNLECAKLLIQDEIDRLYTKYEELEKDYAAGDLHPGDLKEGLKKSLNSILDPVRQHFETDARAKDLLKKVKQYRTTR